MVLAPNWLFFHLFILGNIGKKNVFYDILERKKRLLGCKSKKFKESKNLYFWKDFLLNIGQENVFYDVLNGENAFPRL